MFGDMLIPENSRIIEDERANELQTSYLHPENLLAPIDRIMCVE